MIAISTATLCASVYHALSKTKLVYWKLTLACFVMASEYVLQSISIVL